MTFKKVTISAIVLTGLGLMAYKSKLVTNTPIAHQAVSSIEPEDYRPIVVLELFTSQGCSSCPPADALLDKVKNEFESSIFALSYHVDYWNYIGWEDPFSKSKYAEKQRTYNIKFKNRSNYTPQIVVNGKEHFVGSSSSKLYSTINNYRKEKAINSVDFINVKADNKSISFQYTILGGFEGKTLRAVLVLNRRTTKVTHGENSNRVLTNSNIVVAEKYIDIDGLEGQSFMAIPEIVNPQEKISLFLLVENKDYDITGASKCEVRR